jgi:hypothetical protein
MSYESRIDPPTDNQTYISPESDSGISPEQETKYHYLNLQNTGLWNGRERNDNMARDVDNREQFHVVAGQFELTDHQRDRALYLFINMPDDLIHAPVLWRAVACCSYIQRQDGCGSDYIEFEHECITAFIDDTNQYSNFYVVMNNHLDNEQWTTNE